MGIKKSRKKVSYGEVVILDTSEIEDAADYGGLLYKLKKLGARDGESYQIDNGGDLLMYYDVYERCKKILKEFKVKALGPSFL